MYSQENTLRLAKRFHNTKRTYLLVNPLQAKHVPASPTLALSMMETLGEQLAQAYPTTKLVIGFAETATAIGAAVASRFGNQCVYIHTTREPVPEVTQWVLFQEEHSHAVEQKLCLDSLETWIANTDTVIFVDDEISTGKTLVNMIKQLKQRCPNLEQKTLVAASILNRVSPENEQRLQESGIQCEYLVKLPQEDYTTQVADIQIREASPAESADAQYGYQALFCGDLADPRKGVSFKRYLQNCTDMAYAFLAQISGQFRADSKILVLGTEECMYPALILGRELERFEFDFTVRCHATTRSPIGVSDTPGYPIVSGVKLQSFYDSDRNTYLYDLDGYDAVIVVSDTQVRDMDALKNLMGAIRPYGNTKFYYLQGGRNVWYV